MPLTQADILITVAILLNKLSVPGMRINIAQRFSYIVYKY